MNHIRFLSSNKPVCTHPASLGYDFVVLDTNREQTSCHVCYTLLVAHNERGEHFRRHNDHPTLVVNRPKSLREEEPALTGVVIFMALVVVLLTGLSVWFFINGG